jgi:hypothetical protein
LKDSAKKRDRERKLFGDVCKRRYDTFSIMARTEGK